MAANRTDDDPKEKLLILILLSRWPRTTMVRNRDTGFDNRVMIRHPMWDINALAVCVAPYRAKIGKWDYKVV